MSLLGFCSCLFLALSLSLYKFGLYFRLSSLFCFCSCCNFWPWVLASKNLDSIFGAIDVHFHVLCNFIISAPSISVVLHRRHIPFHCRCVGKEPYIACQAVHCDCNASLLSEAVLVPISVAITIIVAPSISTIVLCRHIQLPLYSLQEHYLPIAVALPTVSTSPTKLSFTLALLHCWVKSSLSTSPLQCPSHRPPCYSSRSCCCIIFLLQRIQPSPRCYIAVALPQVIHCQAIALSIDKQDWLPFPWHPKNCYLLSSLPSSPLLIHPTQVTYQARLLLHPLLHMCIIAWIPIYNWEQQANIQSQ